MEALIGPAIVAAAIAALISVAGWFVTTRQTLALERVRRQEKTRDFQIALRAEIRSELASLEQFNLSEQSRRIRERYSSDPTYAVTVPKTTRHVVFEAIIAEIHILPQEVIDPLIIYARQRQVVESQVADIRDAVFKALPQARQIEIYEDYLEMRRFLLRAAEEAMNALNGSLSE